MISKFKKNTLALAVLLLPLLFCVLQVTFSLLDSIFFSLSVGFGNPPGEVQLQMPGVCECARAGTALAAQCASEEASS